MNRTQSEIIESKYSLYFYLCYCNILGHVFGKDETDEEVTQKVKNTFESNVHYGNFKELCINIDFTVEEQHIFLVDLIKRSPVIDDFQHGILMSNEYLTKSLFYLNDKIGKYYLNKNNKEKCEGEM